MTYKNIFLLAKYILFFIIMLILPHLIYNSFNFFSSEQLLNFIVPYILILVPYIEIKLCQRIATKHSDTPLMKLLSTWTIPIVCLIIFVMLDLFLDVIACAYKNSYYISLLSLREFAQFISFSASFLPVFLTGIWYKYLMSQDITKFAKNNWWIILSIIILSFVLKFTGLFTFAFIHNKIAEFFL